MSTPFPIVVVTGANGGVGYGICHRLLIQLSQKHPSDARPIFSTTDPGDAPVSYIGLTLIMACRSTKRAAAARTKLYALLDAHISRQRRLKGYDGHADVFRRNLRIEIHYLDLGAVQSVFRFGAELAQAYPYVSHLICNAGVASFICIDWPAAFKALLTAPLHAVTHPTYYLQNRGELSVDGLGWVWQCNVFGHYALYRTLQPLLLASPPSLRARVIWTSSLEAHPNFYDNDDWQLIKTEHSYESSKYQTDLIATALERAALPDQSGVEPPIQHVVTDPGIVSTNIQKALVGFVLDMVKIVTFYIARLFGSRHHTMWPYQSAIAAVHVSLVSPSYLPSAFSPSSKVAVLARPVRFGSQTGRWGDEDVGTTEVQSWEKYEGESEKLVERCEALYAALAKVQDGP